MIFKWYSVYADVNMAKKYGSQNVDKPIPLIGPCELSGDHNISQILEHFGAIKLNGQSIIPDYETVLIPLINDKRPIIARWKYADGTGHFVLITGYDSDLKKVLFNDPLKGATELTYSKFCQNDNHQWSHTGFIQTPFTINYSLSPTNYNDESTFNGYSTMGGAISQNGSCTPFVTTGICALVQSVNVHNNSTKIWFGNTKGAYCQFPLYFQKKGNYNLKIKFRGSVFKVKQSVTSGDNCFFSSSWPYFSNVMKDINTFANLNIINPSTNKINNSTSVPITGKDLNGPVCNTETANRATQQNSLNCKCRVYTENEKAELSDVELTFAVKIYQPGTTNFKVTIDDNNYNAILGLSIHGISTEFESDFCGCMDPKATNFDVNASVSDGTCTYSDSPETDPNIELPKLEITSTIINRTNESTTYSFSVKNLNLQSSPIQSYNWDFNDGTFCNEISPIHTFPNNEFTRTVKLTVKTANGTVQKEYTEYTRNFYMNQLGAVIQENGLTMSLFSGMTPDYNGDVEVEVSLDGSKINVLSLMCLSPSPYPWPPCYLYSAQYNDFQMDVRFRGFSPKGRTGIAIFSELNKDAPWLRVGSGGIIEQKLEKNNPTILTKTFATYGSWTNLRIIRSNGIVSVYISGVDYKYTKVYATPFVFGKIYSGLWTDPAKIYGYVNLCNDQTFDNYRLIPLSSSISQMNVKNVLLSNLSKRLLVGSTEVTQGEYYQTIGLNPSNNFQLGSSDWNLPVENITCYDAILFCNARSTLEGLKPVYSFDTPKTTDYNGKNCTILRNLTADLSKNGYRLPTESEWNYAYLAGVSPTANKGLYWLSGQNANDYAWLAANSGNHSNPVGRKLPNNAGIFDMAGNVREWVWTDDLTHGCAASQGDFKANSEAVLSCNSKICYNKSDKWNTVGFRVVRKALPDLTPIINLLLD